MTTPIYLSQPALVSALGSGLTEHLTALFHPPAHSPLTLSDQWITGKAYWFGAVHRPLRPLPTTLPRPHHSRNNQLLWDALMQIEPTIAAVKQRYGAHRIAVVIGTSTSGIDNHLPLFQHMADGKPYQHLPFQQQQQIMSAPADLVQHLYGLHNACYGVSTACTSGARAIISAARLLKSGLCDAVICGGVDTLSRLTINGFHALEVLSPNIAQPFSAQRNGINIGEAAAVFIATREPLTHSLPLLAYSASSDAYHMSSPRPDGLGAIHAFQQVLQHAQCTPQDIGWINLHGTGTQHNDQMESIAVNHVFGQHTPATSTKPLTGHTLGAAGALEAALLWGVVSRVHNPQGILPPHLWDNQADSALPPIALTHPNSHWTTQRRIGISSSFAFGGSNSVIMIGETC